MWKNILRVLALSLFALTSVASAHPLGNFSINQFARITPGVPELRIHQVIDMAEIPTLQESAKIDTDRDGTLSEDELASYGAAFTPGYLANLHLLINGKQVSIKAVATELKIGKGAGDLSTLRFEWDLSASVPVSNDASNVVYRNLNFPDRLGWNEIVIERHPGLNVFDSDGFGSGLTDELKTYPQDLLTAPLAERSAVFSFSAATAPPGARPLLDREGRPTVAVQKDKLAELISVDKITPAIVIIGILIALGLGALHAMSPGHGKTIVGAYLVGSRGTVKHAIFLGLTVTVTHTLGVFALGLLTLFASNFILPEKIMPFLTFTSGLLVLYIGLTMFKSRLLSALGFKGHSHSHGEHSHSHGETHEHEHTQDRLTHTHDGHTHSHLPPETVSWKSLLALGVSGGLLPCPSALVLMLSAISLGRIGYGLVLTLAFSTGLAATLTAVGLTFLFIDKAFGGLSISRGRILKALPVFSAFVIACLGAAICYSSLG